MKIFIPAFFITSLLVGCTGSDKMGPTKKTIEIDAYMQPCTGEGISSCLRIREKGEDNFSVSYDQIKGFNFVPGHTYTLEIEEITILDPPQDGSSVEMRLIRIISDKISTNSYLPMPPT